MKQAKQRRVKPRNPLALAPVMKKGGPHQRVDDRASRARKNAALRRELKDGQGRE
jgi:hypothetical protein